MSNVEDYKNKLAALEAIPDDKIIKPNSIPIDVYLQEAENLWHWSREDQAELRENGLDKQLIDDLPIRCGALREAESRWKTSRFTYDEAEKAWLEKSPEAYDFRNELLRIMRFAYRKLPELLSRVDAIAEGYGHADMIQDLNDLAVLGKEHIDPLEEINFEVKLLDKAATMADELANLLGATSSQRADGSDTLLMRNRAFTHLKEAVDEVRDYGRFVFFRDKVRYRGYTSEHLRKRNRRKENNQEPVTVS